MVDLRRIAIIFVIAVLYAVLVNAIVDAVYPAPKYDDYCKQRFYPEKVYPAEIKVTCPKYNEPTAEELQKCSDKKGFPDYVRDANGCPTQYIGCNTCQVEFDNANEKYNFYVFLISSVLAIIAIAIALILPTEVSLNEWIATGFMLGGLFSLFYGTARYYQYLGRYLRPVIILFELIIVIFLSYRKLRDSKTDKKKR